MCVKGVAQFQESLMLENDNGDPFIGIGVAKIVGWYLSWAVEEPFFAATLSL